MRKLAICLVGCGLLLPVGSAQAAQEYTLVEVQKHATPSDCWTIVGNTVYDLTKWINQHPGGIKDVEGMCGIDATGAFSTEHTVNAPGPVEDALKLYRLGPLGTGVVAPQPTPSASTTATTAAVDPLTLVGQHRTLGDCWATIGGKAYNLTPWVKKQSGAAALAKSVCGKDATRVLTKRFKTTAKLKSALTRYLV